MESSGEQSEKTEVTELASHGRGEDWNTLPDTVMLSRSNRLESSETISHDRKLGLTWNNITIKGLGADAAVNENVLSQFVPAKIQKGNNVASIQEKAIVEASHGSVKPGEMLLVLGRPGAGCTSLLKVLANRRNGFSDITGDVKYGSMDHIEASKYRGQIVMNTEEEIFFPTLTVGQTIDFATRLKVPKFQYTSYSTPEEARIATRDFYLKKLGISHTFNTRVGNEYIRGVSGGERKRVSIIETMATRGSIYCWDNSTRGLDANTALEYVKAVRALTDIFGLASIITLYQAGNGIYDQFDKVLVLDEGREIFFGPRTAAKPFFEDLGFVCVDGANIADFLTGVTVPTERKIREGFEDRFPRDAATIRSIYDASDIRRQVEQEYDYSTSDVAKINTATFVRTVAAEKHKSLLMKALPITLSDRHKFFGGDKAVIIIKQLSNLLQALLTGSLFYNAPDTSPGLFLRSGAVFTSLLFNALLSQSEVTDSFSGRPVLAKHKGFALHHPAAWCLAQIITDVPIILFQVSAFSLVVYFMTGLANNAGAFFTFWFTLVAITFCLTALFRAIGAGFSTFDGASKLSGLAVLALLLYNGYMIPKPDMHPWFVWLFWIDPFAYAYDALLSNEFNGKVINCVGPNLVPSGPGYNPVAGQACTGVRGAVTGASSVTGEQYLDSLSYSHSNLWRNIGIVWVWWVFFVMLTIVFTSHWKENSAQNEVPLVPRELVVKTQPPVADEESQQREKDIPASSGSSETAGDEKIDTQLIRNTSVFTWRNLTYTVNTSDGPRDLLNNVHGCVKPGMLGALMGASGAGKTTLLDVLAQRKTDGTIRGAILVDGKPLKVSFQRSAGYCEQLDVHEPLTTVREALEFSALLRQSRDTPREEKLRYVDVILDLLEMHDIENSLVGYPGGAGLSIEQRKRLTIGVELVAKPSILIFLDEPTSGLDGQSAFNTVRFLKQLAAAGQAVLVTIHQPSAQLFAEFDTLLLLAKGGKTVYFGDIGDNANTVREYFARNEAPCPPEKNPAEHMIDVVSDTTRDWNSIWLESKEHSDMLTELDRLTEERAAAVPNAMDDGHEFAMPLWDQIRIVTSRANKALYRNTDYVNNKFVLHILTGLFCGFSFWSLDNAVSDLTLRLFAMFNFIFVSTGVIAQLQPLFIDKRNIYDAREKKSKMYSWIAFVTALIVSEVPYLVICAIQFFFTFYYTVGFPSDTNKAGAVFFIMLVYEFFYTGMGQFIAAYAPNAVAATLVNPLVIFTLAGFSGTLVPYGQITAFWRYWLYYLNPFNYLIGALMVFTTWEVQVTCKESELAIFNPADNQTCGTYLGPYLQGVGSGANLLNPDALESCRVCQYREGKDYLRTLNLLEYDYGWRNAGIVTLFTFSSYALVYLLMKLRTKSSKKAEM
ncbi:ABC-2 type transporter-like protein 4 [Elsinoe fawcettii]|nr:ABC-2 type transporter-like protein 4 [Elsinoe fawcettii]